MSDPQPSEDIERIRQKRLAKLEQLQKAQDAERQAQAAASSSTASPVKGGSPMQTSPTSTPLSSTSNIPATKDLARTPTPTVKKEAAPPQPAPAATPQPKAAPRPVLSPEEAAAVWEDRTLSHIFRVSVQQNSRTPEYHVLDSLRNELEESGAPLRLNVDLLDNIILSLGPELQQKFIPADYLLASWRRAAALQRSLRDSKPDSHKTEVLQTVRQRCINYLGLCFTMPEMFEQCPMSGSFAKYLLIDPENSHGMSAELLNDIAASITSQEEGGEYDLRDVVMQALDELREKLSELDITEAYKPYLDAFLRISSVKPLGALLCKLPTYTGEGCTGADIEKRSVLGPILRLSPMQIGPANKYFASQQGRVIDEATRALRLTFSNIKHEQFTIVNNLVRTSPECRNKTLDFFAKVMNLNHKRRAIQVEPGTVSSDGFMVNLSILLTRFCEPFMDSTFSKVSKVEVDYFRRRPRLDISDETKLNADEQSSKDFYSNKAEGASNFISEIFFLAVAANHYGILAAQGTHDTLYRDLSEMEKSITRLKEEIQKLQALNNPQVVLWQRNLMKLEERVKKGHAYRQALEVLLFDTSLLTPFINFSRFFTVWVLRLVSPTHDYPEKPISLPLPDTPPVEYSNLPEYFLEVIGDWYSFIGRNFPALLIQINELIVFSIVFLRMTSYVKNPQEKTKLVELFYYGTQPTRNKPSGVMGDTLNGLPFALDHLMNALMNFYIDIEPQYYHKFSVRFYISEIIQKIWSNKAYREKLEQESTRNEKFFVRFVALLLNDVTLVMDNSLTALSEIHKIQTELSDSQAVSRLTQEELQSKESALAKAQREASQYTSLANETIKMLSLFTAAIPAAFTKPELVGRLAGMLDYNLETLAGPKSRNLSVKNPEQYHFRPRRTLSTLTDVYLNLHTRPEFIQGVAQDGRSYKPANFDRLYHILAKYSLKSREELEKIKVFAKVVEETKRALDEGEEELGDIPDEFIDPILATLMEDPVILPSGVTMDRTAIAGIVLSDGKDPYTRAPLTMEMVKPNVELKAKIDAFIAEKRAERAQKRVAATLNAGGSDGFGNEETEGNLADSEPMDIDG